jgi:hypothetical protein
MTNKKILDLNFNDEHCGSDFWGYFYWLLPGSVWFPDSFFLTIFMSLTNIRVVN